MKLICAAYQKYHRLFLAGTIVVVTMLLSLMSIHNAQAYPFWLPDQYPHDMPVKYFAAYVQHVNMDTGIMRVCVTDVNTTLGACHYMNATEEENPHSGNDIMAYAGVFVFDPTEAPAGSYVQVCLKLISAHQEQCTWHINHNATNTTTYVLDTQDLIQPHVIASPEIGKPAAFDGIRA